MTFAAGLRAALRQDPDIILVGEIRDKETASIAAQASLTGHLVFSSLHANGSVGAVVRLRDLGLDDFLIAATLRGVIAQRLLRKLCLECRQSTAPDPEAARHFSAAGLPAPERHHLAKGCDTCNGTGYAGRVGVFEILEVSEDLRAAIDAGQSETEMKRVALPPEQTLFGQALHQVAAGRTSLAEALRVVGDAL
jgi:general secretion pathway protein E